MDAKNLGTPLAGGMHREETIRDVVLFADLGMFQLLPHA